MTNAIKTLIGICLLLLITLLIEWQLGKPAQQMSALVKAIDRDNSLVELPKLKITEQTAESYSQMVENPLFIQGRKPILVEGGGEQNEQVVGKIDDLSLQGLYSIQDKKIALFQAKGKDKNYLKKSEGEDVAGWKLIEIKVDSVVMEQHGKQQTLMLRKPKPKVAKRVKPVRTSRKKVKK